MRRLVKWVVVGFVLLAVAGALSHSERKHAPSAAAATLTPSPTVSVTRQGAPRRRHHRHHKRLHRAVAAAAATSTPTPTPAVLVACDANIRVRAATTTCPFAENVFYEYYEKTFGYPDTVTVRAWSAAAHEFFRVRCRGHEAIVCRAGDGGEARFSAASVAAYDDDQAARFAAAHDTGDGADAAAADGGAGENIPNYDNGTGYRVQCADGMYSHSGGRPGACSGHGGER